MTFSDPIKAVVTAEHLAERNSQIMYLYSAGKNIRLARKPVSGEALLEIVHPPVEQQ
jgi:hypothetical protein